LTKQCPVQKFVVSELLLKLDFISVVIEWIAAIDFTVLAQEQLTLAQVDNRGLSITSTVFYGDILHHEDCVVVSTCDPDPSILHFFNVLSCKVVDCVSVIVGLSCELRIQKCSFAPKDISVGVKFELHILWVTHSGDVLTDHATSLAKEPLKCVVVYVV